MPEVTVVIPTRNRRNLLLQALGSVLAQRDVALEVIVVDDASNDGTKDAVAALNETRVRLFCNEETQGVSAARNLGLAHASGAWIAFLDDDDLWAGDKLLRQLEALRGSASRWSFCGHVVVDDALQVIAGGHPPSAEEVLQRVLFRNVVVGGASSVLAHKHLLDEVGSFDDAIKHLADWDLWIRLALNGAPAVIDAPLVACRLHSGNASSETWSIPREMTVVEERYRSERGGAPIDRAYIYRWIAWNDLRSGRRGDAVRAYISAVANGNMTSLVRAAVACFCPSVATKVRRRAKLDTPWRSQAEAWLRPLSKQ